MPLEMSSDQRAQVMGTIIGLHLAGSVEGIADTLWPLIRDMVLEAAARECMTEAKEHPHAWDRLRKRSAEACAKRIRAMKGKP